MISWSAYAPRRARDPIAWMIAKRIVTPAGLREELTALGIDPQTFPQDIADSHLGTPSLIPDAEPSVCLAASNEVEGASSGSEQAAAKKAMRRAVRSSPS